MAYGRIETFIYSSSVGEHIGGSIVKVVCENKDTANQKDFIDFCNRVAQVAYVCQAASWEILILFDRDFHIVNEKELLEKSLGEKVTVEGIKCFSLMEAREEYDRQVKDWRRY